jgi:chitinase
MTSFSSKKIIGYFAQWDLYDRKYSVSDIPADKLTHLMYCFCLPNPSRIDYDLLVKNHRTPPSPYTAPPTLPEGTLIVHDGWAFSQHIKDLKALKTSYPNLKICISIGGASLSWNMSKILANPTTRKTFVNSSVSFILKHGFDGFDLDWEYPGKKGASYNYVDAVNDAKNMVIFLRELRQALNTRSPSKYIEISVASGCTPEVISQYKDCVDLIDSFNVMTYDFYGGWGDGGHNAGLFPNPANKGAFLGFDCHNSTLRALSIFPKNKICIGCPFYGRGWKQLVSDRTNPSAPIIFGISKAGAATTLSAGSGGEEGLSCWKDLRDVVGKNGFTKYVDTVSRVPYLHNISTGETWSYDDVESVKEKAKYVLDNDLGGIMIWQLSDDVRDGRDSLLDVIADTFAQ